MPVADYIPKYNLNRDSLLDVLKATAKAIQKKRFIKIGSQMSEDPAFWGQQCRQERVLMNLLAGKIRTSEEVSRYLQSSSLSIETHNVKFIIMELDNMNRFETCYNDIEICNMMNTISNSLQKVLDSFNGYIQHICRGRFVILFSYGDDYKRFLVNDSMIIDALREKLKRYMDLTACFVVGEMCRSITELPERYNLVLEMLKQRFYLGNDVVITQGTTTKRAESFMTLDKRYEKEIVDALITYDFKSCMKTIDSIFQDMMDQKVSPSSCQIISVELITLLVRHTKDILPFALHNRRDENNVKIFQQKTK